MLPSLQARSCVAWKVSLQTQLFLCVCVCVCVTPLSVAPFISYQVRPTDPHRAPSNSGEYLEPCQLAGMYIHTVQHRFSVES